MSKALHPAAAEILRHFEPPFGPPALREVNDPIRALAHRVAGELEGPELTAGLRKLLEARDCLLRAVPGVTGRAVITGPGGGG